MISKEFLDKFKSLYQTKYNVTLTDEEATEKATSFINLMRVVLKPKRKQNEANRNNTKFI